MRKIKEVLIGLDQRFGYRGKSATRIEAFSDGVFAVAFALVVLTSSVPETFDELRAMIQDILPSFICIVLLVLIWYQHYIFFLRYGLQNPRIVTINAFLLFMVLIYVYPLKFLARFLVELYGALIFGTRLDIESHFGGGMNAENMSLLMTTYGLGAALIFLTLVWMFRHAYLKREELDLDEYEIFVTKISINQNLLMSSLPIISTMVAFFQPFSSDGLNFTVAGFVYMLYPVIMPIFGHRVQRSLENRFP